MFDFITKTVGLAVDIATIPVSVAADVVTLGGTLTDRDETYTETKVERVLDKTEDWLDDFAG